MTIALSGSTGAVGSAVLSELSGRLPGPPVLIGRDASTLPEGFPHRQAVYGDRDAMKDALAGVDTFFFVSGRESATRLEEHRTVVNAATDAGVARIVYLSFLGAAADSTFTLGRHHFHTEEAIKASGLAYTFLRDSLYQDFLPFMTGEDGVIRGPAGEGRLSAVARQDVAAVVSEILMAADTADRAGDAGAADVAGSVSQPHNTPSPHDGMTYDITGPEALTLAEVADLVTVASGRQVTFHDETEAEAYESRAKYNAPAFEVEGWVTSYQSIGVGEMSHVSGDVERILGRPPIRFADWLAQHPESLAHLV